MTLMQPASNIDKQKQLVEISIYLFLLKFLFLNIVGELLIVYNYIQLYNLHLKTKT